MLKLLELAEKFGIVAKKSWTLDKIRTVLAQSSRYQEICELVLEIPGEVEVTALG